MCVKLLTEHNLEFLSVMGGCTGSSKSTHFKIPHCWKSHVAAHMFADNPDSIKPLIFEVKLCICYNRYLAIYMSVIIYTLKRKDTSEAMFTFKLDVFFKMKHFC